MESSSSNMNSKDAESVKNILKQILKKDIPVVRAKLLTKQKMICPICLRTIKDPNLDHDHTTGAVRDVLCRNCNRVEGKVLHWVKTIPGNRVEILRRLAHYWVRHKVNRHGLIHPGKTTKRKKRKKK